MFSMSLIDSEDSSLCMCLFNYADCGDRSACITIDDSLVFLTYLCCLPTTIVWIRLCACTWSTIQRHQVQPIHMLRYIILYIVCSKMFYGDENKLPTLCPR